MIEFFNQILEFLDKGIYEIMTQFASWLVLGISYMWIQGQISALTFAWDVGQKLLVDLNISAYMQQAFAHFDTQTLNTVMFFRIPEFINNIMGALSARFVMRILGL